MLPHTVHWKDGPPETVISMEEIDSLLDRLHDDHSNKEPILVRIDGPYGEIVIGLGSSESFLTHIHPDGMPPYLISSNNTGDEKEIDFFYAGHHSPTARKTLISLETARRAVRTFVEHHALLLDVRWQET